MQIIISAAFSSSLSVPFETLWDSSIGDSYLQLDADQSISKSVKTVRISYRKKCGYILSPSKIFVVKIRGLDQSDIRSKRSGSP